MGVVGKKNEQEGREQCEGSVCVCVCVWGGGARGKVQCNSLRKFPMHFAHIFLSDLSLLYLLYKLLSFRESASKKEKP